MPAKISGVSIVKLDEKEVVIPKNSSKRVSWWRVTLGKKITGTKKLRRYFSLEREAKQFIEAALANKSSEGHEAFALSGSLRVEAGKCQEMLDEAAERVGRSLSLTQAVGFFLRHALPQGGAQTFEKARDAFMANRRDKNLKPRYLVNLESQFRKLEDGFAGERVNLINSTALEKWFAEQKWSPKTKNNYVITLRSFFDYCVRQKWCAENPADALDKAESDQAVAGILCVADVARLLEAAKGFPDTLPAVAIQLFAGLRRSEVCALDWAEVKSNVIEVTAAKAKTRSRRVVDIQENLSRWIAPYRRAAGPVFAKSEDFYHDRLLAIRRAVNALGSLQQPSLAPIIWKHNCLRHTCASMHLAYFEKDNYTALQMGHGVDILHKHYKGLVQREDAAVFWQLRPAIC